MNASRLGPVPMEPRPSGEPRQSPACSNGSSYRTAPSPAGCQDLLLSVSIGSVTSGASARSSSSVTSSASESVGSDDEVRQVLLDALAHVPTLHHAEERANAVDTLVCVALDRDVQTSQNADAISRVISYVNRDEVIGERLALLGDAIDAATDRGQLGEINDKLANLQRVVRPGPGILSVLALRRRLEAQREALAGGLGAPLARQPARIDPLAPFAELLDNPATKAKVAHLDNADALAAAHGPEVAEASYLVPTAEASPIYRLGKTVANGGFSKIRDFIDEDGNVGKMRVLHLHRQRGRHPRVRVSVTPPESLLLERRASVKAGSPVAFERAFSVVHDGRAPVVKLYVPMPSLGVEASYFGARTSLAAQYPAKEVAAAMRAYIASVNQTLVKLHRNDAHGAGMVHQDIKPANVLISEAGEVNLIDFGLAEATAQVSRRRSVSGTRGYHAPESLAVLDGGCARLWPVTDKLDVWSLAVSTMSTFFGEHGRKLPQQVLADIHYRPTSLKSLSSAEHNDYQNYFARRTLYFGALQEYWTQNLDGLDPSETYVAEYERTRPEGMTGDEEVQYAHQFGEQLEALRLAVEAVDPDVGRWFFRHFYRVDPTERFDTTQLAEALNALPPLHGSHQADREVAKRLFADAFPRARRLFEAGQRPRVDGGAGPSVAQLAALPPTPPTLPA